MNIHHWDRKPGVIRKNLLLNNTKSWFWGSSGQQCDRQRYHHFFKYLSPRVAQRTQTSDGENRRKRRQWCHHSTQCSTHPTCSAGLPHCTFEHHFNKPQEFSCTWRWPWKRDFRFLWKTPQNFLITPHKWASVSQEDHLTDLDSSAFQRESRPL